MGLQAEQGAGEPVQTEQDTSHTVQFGELGYVPVGQVLIQSNEYQYLGELHK